MPKTTRAGIPGIRPYAMPTEGDLPRNRASWQLRPDRAVLLIHDMQQYFVDFLPVGCAPRTNLVDNLVRLRTWADQCGVPVVYSAQPGGMTPAQRGLLTDFWGPGMRTDEQDRRIVPELRPSAADVVMTKWRYSAFVRTDLATLIRDCGRDQLIIGGVYAHVGCLMTACDAFSLDIAPFLVADALADFSRAEHDLALSYAARRCAVNLTTRQVLRSSRPVRLTGALEASHSG